MNKLINRVNKYQSLTYALCDITSNNIIKSI